MKKILEDELMSLAHSILQMKDREDIEKLQKAAGELHEKLSVLAFTERHFDGPRPRIGRSDIAAALKKEQEAPRQDATPVSTDESPKEKEPEKETEPAADLSGTAPEKTAETPDKSIASKTEKPSESAPAKPQEKPMPRQTESDDLRDIAVHYDDLPQFEPIGTSQPSSSSSDQPQQEKPASEREQKETAPRSQNKTSASESKSQPHHPDGSSSSQLRRKNDLASHQRSLNEHFHQGLNFGLNDRLAFINHLFEGNATDFNRVISQLNTLDNFTEAKTFIEQQVKPDYDWDNKEVYEERFILAIEKRLE